LNHRRRTTPWMEALLPRPCKVLSTTYVTKIGVIGLVGSSRVQILP
jgi:hypothetical protein